MIAPGLILGMLLIQVGPYAGAPDVVLPKTAERILFSALPKYERHLSGFGFERYEGTSNRFYFFTAVWNGPKNGSVVAGNYAVDKYTGDVWSATSSCNELSTVASRKLQAKVRSELGLSVANYQKIKTHGPLCDE